MFELLEDRFEETTGVELATCWNIDGEQSWGDDCTAVLRTFKSDMAIGDLDVFETREEALEEDNIVCHVANDAGLDPLLGAELCTLVPLNNGMWRWEDASTVTCVNPTDFSAKTGSEEDGCILVDGSW